MKPKINLLALTAALVIFISLTAGAQSDKSAAWANQPNTNKNHSVSAESKMATGSLPEKLLLNFNHNFPSAVNTKWTTTADAFFANFSIGEKPGMASFNKKGEFVYALIYGSETDLNVTIQQELKKSYPSFTVYKVVEIKMPGSVNYQVILQNANGYVDLRVSEDGQLQETKKTTKTEG